MHNVHMHTQIQMQGIQFSFHFFFFTFEIQFKIVFFLNKYIYRAYSVRGGALITLDSGHGGHCFYFVVLCVLFVPSHKYIAHIYCPVYLHTSTIHMILETGSCVCVIYSHIECVCVPVRVHYYNTI